MKLARSIAAVVSLSIAGYVALSFEVRADRLRRIRGTAGDDVIDASYNPPTTDEDDDINALGGNDLVRAGGGKDEVDGGPGEDELFGEAGDDLLLGSAGDDILHGGDDNDTLEGGNGNNILFGDGGNDVLKGGSHHDYLDGGDGGDVLLGESGADLLVGRDGDDELIAGPGDDMIVIIGSSLDGYTIFGHTPNVATPSDSGFDLLFFAAEIDPQDTSLVIDGAIADRNLAFERRTGEAVILNVGQANNLHHIEAFATGSGDDHIIGTDLAGNNTYQSRFFRASTPLDHIDELFFTAEGNDTIETRGGNDFVDCGEGDDTVLAGPGAHFILTGPGADAVRFQAAEFDGGALCRVVDFSPDDQILIEGAIDATAVTVSESLVDGVATAAIAVNGRTEIALPAIPQANVQVAAADGGVRITTNVGLDGAAMRHHQAMDERLGGQFATSGGAVPTGNLLFRLCTKCAGLLLGGAGGPCGAGNSHAPGLKTSFYLPDQTPSHPYEGWVTCTKCALLFSSQLGSHCPDSGLHAASTNPPMYFAARSNTPAGYLGGWKFCIACHQLFLEAQNVSGCAAPGFTAHVAESGTTAYTAVGKVADSPVQQSEGPKDPGRDR